MSGDPYRYFRIEARELVGELSQATLALERGASPIELAARMLRLAHTLKGAARVVRLPAIAEHAHAIEETLAPLREGSVVGPAGVDDVLRRLDAVGALLDALDAPTSTPTTNDRRDVGGATAPGSPPGSTRPDEPLGSVRVDREDVERVLRALADAERELEAAREAGADRGRLARALERVDRGLVETREAAEHLHLTPVRQLRPALERAVRDVAAAVGKEAELSLVGDDLRLEGTVVAEVARALQQLVRNAVAHGVEPPDGRRAAGKPRAGAVEVRVERRGGLVSFVVRDDGAGVDVDAVRALAARRGLSTDDLAPDEVPALLLAGGLSTAARVTEVSGRGIGLDLVRDVAAQLGGSVRITTERGRGTTVELTVTASRAALEALLVEVAGAKVAIPLSCVVEARSARDDELRTDASGDAISHGGALVPFARLTRVIDGGLPGDGGPGRRPGRSTSAVVIRGGGAMAALGVERIVGAQRIVVRSLPPLAAAATWIGGAALDRDGAPRLVVEAAALVQAIAAVPAEERSEVARLPVLVVDDSLTTRMLEKTILEGAGHVVDLATCGEEGLRRARERPHAVFLVDVEMPDIDGFTFIERARADPALASTPAILVTSRDAPEDRARGAEVGAAGYVVKGELDQRELLAMIERLMR